MSLPTHIQKRWPAIPTVCYALFIILFSIWAREVYNWLIASLGASFLKAAVWSAFALAISAAAWAGRGLGLRTSGLILLLAAAGIAYAATFEIFEERIHLVKYGLLGLLLCRDFDHRPAWRGFVLTVFCAFVVACLDETVQYFTPGRVADLRDVAFDVLGAGWGALACLILRRRAA